MQIKCFFSHNSRNEHVLSFASFKSNKSYLFLCQMENWIQFKEALSYNPVVVRRIYVTQLCPRMITTSISLWFVVSVCWTISHSHSNIPLLLYILIHPRSVSISFKHLSLVLHKQQLVHGKSWPPGVIYQHKIYNVQLSVNGKLKYKPLTPWWLWRWFAASQQQRINVFIMILCIVLHSTVMPCNQNVFQKKWIQGKAIHASNNQIFGVHESECKVSSIHIFRNAPNISEELFDGHFKPSENNISQNFSLKIVIGLYIMLSSRLFSGPDLAC